MSQPFAGWTEFFVVAATTAGALLGLLFVALSMHLRLLERDTHSDLRMAAGATLQLFLVAFLLAILPLIPQDGRALGYEVLIIVVVMNLISVVTWRRFYRRPHRQFSAREIAMRFANQILYSIAGVVIAVGLLSSDLWPAYAIAGLTIYLLGRAVVLTWDLVFRSAAASQR